MEPCLPGNSYTSACQWEVLNVFFIFLCLHMQFLLYSLNSLYLSPRLFSLLPFWFSPPSCWGGSVWACGCVGLSFLVGFTHNSWANLKLYSSQDCFSGNFLQKMPTNSKLKQKDINKCKIQSTLLQYNCLIEVSQNVKVSWWKGTANVVVF